MSRWSATAESERENCISSSRRRNSFAPSHKKLLESCARRLDAADFASRWSNVDVRSSCKKANREKKKLKKNSSHWNKAEETTFVSTYEQLLLAVEAHNDVELSDEKKWRRTSLIQWAQVSVSPVNFRSSSSYRSRSSRRLLRHIIVLWVCNANDDESTVKVEQHQMKLSKITQTKR